LGIFDSAITVVGVARLGQIRFQHLGEVGAAECAKSLRQFMEASVPFEPLP
jgi:hypothetical protein